MNRLILSLFLMLFGASAQAQTPDYNSGNYLLPICKLLLVDSIPPDADLAGIGVCAGTIRTLIVTGSFFQADRRYCVPDEVTIRQAAQVVVNWMDRKPQYSHLHFIALSQLAMREAWPCQ